MINPILSYPILSLNLSVNLLLIIHKYYGTGQEQGSKTGVNQGGGARRSFSWIKSRIHVALDALTPPPDF